MGHLLGASCGYRKPFRGPRTGSRSLQIEPNSVRPTIHPYEFFFRADSGATKWNSSRRNEKKDVQKSDIALITSSRSSTFDAHLQISYDPFEGFTISSAFAGGATCPAGSF